MNLSDLFSLFVGFLAARVPLRERPPKPNARRDDFPRGADAVPDRKRTPLAILLIALLVVAAVLIILVI